MGSFSSVPSCVWSAFGSFNPKAGRGRDGEGAERVLLKCLYLGLMSPAFQGHLTSHCFAWSMKSRSLAAAEQSVTPLFFKTFPNSSFQWEPLNSKREIISRVDAEGKDADKILSKVYKQLLKWLEISSLGRISVVSPTHPLLCLAKCLYSGTAASIQ